MPEHIDWLIKEVVGHKPTEQIGLIFDKTYEQIARLIIEYCTINKIHIIPIPTIYTPGFMSEEVRACFLQDLPQIIILGLKENIWHTPERKTAKYDKNKRLVNLIHPGEPCASYFAQSQTINSVGRQLEDMLKDSKEIHVTTPRGTDLRAKIGIVFCESEDYRKPRSGGDFPFGEVGFGPIEGTVNGTIVYDLKIQHVGLTGTRPHIIRVSNDEVTITEATPEFHGLLKTNPVLKYISEISLGINPVWVESADAQSIIEEKNLGTIHFGHGGNLSYGNRKGPHFDAVVTEPTIYLDNRLVMQEGKFNERYISLKNM